MEKVQKPSEKEIEALAKKHRLNYKKVIAELGVPETPTELTSNIWERKSFVNRGRTNAGDDSLTGLFESNIVANEPPIVAKTIKTLARDHSIYSTKELLNALNGGRELRGIGEKSEEFIELIKPYLESRRDLKEAMGGIENLI